MRRSRDRRVMGRIIPAQNRLVQEELIRVILKARFVMKEKLELVSPLQMASHFQRQSASWGLIVVDESCAGDYGMLTQYPKQPFNERGHCANPGRLVPNRLASAGRTATQANRPPV